MSAATASGPTSLAAGGEVSQVRKRTSFWRRLVRHRLALFGLIFLVCMGLGALLTPLLSPYDPYAMNLPDAKQEPSLSHPLGTDKLGRDTLTRVLVGGRVSMAVALGAVAISTSIGTVLGVLAGYRRGWVDSIISRVTDIFMSFPLFVLLIVLVSMVGPSVLNVVLIIGLFSWMVITRVVRGQVMSVMNEPYIEAADAAGASPIQVIVRHILPNSYVPVVVASTLGIASAMLSEAALSFLGLGIQPPTPSWGNMLNEAQSLQVLVNEPWVWVGPGLAIALTVLSINFVGDGLRDALDPHAHR